MWYVFEEFGYALWDLIKVFVSLFVLLLYPIIYILKYILSNVMNFVSLVLSSIINLVVIFGQIMKSLSEYLQFIPLILIFVSANTLISEGALALIKVMLVPEVAVPEIVKFRVVLAAIIAAPVISKMLVVGEFRLIDSDSEPPEFKLNESAVMLVELLVKIALPLMLISLLAKISPPKVTFDALAVVRLLIARLLPIAPNDVVP